jgi:hypothetical protein
MFNLKEERCDEGDAFYPNAAEHDGRSDGEAGPLANEPPRGSTGDEKPEDTLAAEFEKRSYRFVEGAPKCG